MSFLRHLTASLREVDLIHNVTAQQEISAKAEEMACDAIAVSCYYHRKLAHFRFSRKRSLLISDKDTVSTEID